MKIGIVQICSGLNYKRNLEKIRSFLDQAKSQGVEKVFLPESFYSMSDGTEPTPYLIKADDQDDEHYLNIRQLATDYSISILGGSASTIEGDRIYNRSYNFDKDGNDLGSYDKNHLFSCDIERKTIDESDIFTPGTSSSIIQDQDLKIGISICVDIRYPQMYLDYIRQGVNLLSIAAAFTVPTGKAHWHILVRARAIEGQCFVVAPAQWGRNNHRIETFGHSLIVDPWGEVLADAENGEKLITADIDLTKIETVRKAVKVSF
uniref:Predicted amidohydrolase n=1 Tax=Candidatus Kentrum sp. TUN TaxID=2126343 RepID=A0A450ZGU4_9GAMM|nr:MAG: Predicted amidohydrolase [Candidatus Kentron sp. TUN]VFK59366.1 MAG: Predicted amidohydrolase [Candidatus Kentron sp. TUN]VFK67943.1 MAG: Predicted amidohydrolase [Candidatus Kentron sp. TUN]